MMKRGDSARVLAVDGGHPSAKRLADLGFIPGATVEMLHPGTPCIVKLAHARLGLSACLQGSVLLAPQSFEAAGSAPPQRREPEPLVEVPRLARA
ncbi:MAG: ferrous iron transport protein A [Phycisphaerales bacterium]|nr:ferrous iron transport protein A [Phycisphaerales bacterium]